MIKTNDSRSVTSKWSIVNDQSNTNFNVVNDVINGKEIVKPNIPGFYDAYILVRGNITVLATHGTHVACKDCAPFTNCITKIDETAINDAEGLDLVMLMYDLTEYSSDYFDTTERLWFYSEDEANNFHVVTANTENFKSFKC